MEFFAEYINDCNERTEIDGHLHREGVEHAQVTVVLAEEDEHGLIEIVDVTVVGLIGRLTLEMDDGERQVQFCQPPFNRR